MMPCLNCPWRYPRCHATCAEYQAEREKLDGKNEVKARAQEVSNAIYAMNTESIKRAHLNRRYT